MRRIPIVRCLLVVLGWGISPCPARADHLVYQHYFESILHKIETHEVDSAVGLRRMMQVQWPEVLRDKVASKIDAMFRAEPIALRPQTLLSLACWRSSLPAYAIREAERLLPNAERSDRRQLLLMFCRAELRLADDTLMRVRQISSGSDRVLSPIALAVLLRAEPDDPGLIQRVRTQLESSTAGQPCRMAHAVSMLPAHCCESFSEQLRGMLHANNAADRVTAARAVLRFSPADASALAVVAELLDAPNSERIDLGYFVPSERGNPVRWYAKETFRTMARGW